MNAFFRFYAFRWTAALLGGVALGALTLLAGVPPAACFTIAAAPPLSVWSHEHLRLSRWCRRWFATGYGAAGEWMSPVELKRHTRPLPEKLP